MQSIQRPTPIFLVVVSKHMKKQLTGVDASMYVYISPYPHFSRLQDLVICQACQTYTLAKTNAALEHLSGPICAYTRIGRPPCPLLFCPTSCWESDRKFYISPDTLVKLGAPQIFQCFPGTNLDKFFQTPPRPYKNFWDFCVGLKWHLGANKKCWYTPKILNTHFILLIEEILLSSWGWWSIPLFTGFYTSQVVVREFWTINSIISCIVYLGNSHRHAVHPPDTDRGYSGQLSRWNLSNQNRRGGTK